MHHQRGCFVEIVKYQRISHRKDTEEKGAAAVGKEALAEGNTGGAEVNVSNAQKITEIAQLQHQIVHALLSVDPPTQREQHKAFQRPVVVVC